MTVGEKIRKYRSMKGLTQKQLGQEVGFSSATADSRIRKYESDIMSPKSDIRGKIADALDVDISALSDIDVQSFVDVMRVFFLLEEKLGMRVEDHGETTSLVFDNTDKNNSLLASFLYVWGDQKSRQPEETDESEEKSKIRDQYNRWKARFPQDLYAYWDDQIDQVTKKYAPIMKKEKNNRKPIIRLSDFLQRLRELLESGVNMLAETRTSHQTGNGIVLEFYASELLNPVSVEAERSFAGLLLAIEDFKEYGMNTETDAITMNDGTRIRYFLWCPPLMNIVGTIDNIRYFVKHRNEMNDYQLQISQKSIDDDMATFDINLKNNIESFAPRE